MTLEVWGLPETGPVPRPDLLIVARGGGSLEDLWAFNEEIVVRAAAASKIPLISAIGHETDVTLIDFAADLRAPTPTAAAEMAVPVRAELLADVLDHARRMVGGMARLLTERRSRLEALRRGLPDPVHILSTAMQRLDDRAERLSLAMTNLRVRLADLVAKTAARLRRPEILINEKRSQLGSESRAFTTAAKSLVAHARLRLDHAAALLESFSFKRVLDRGFALVTDAGERPVTAAAALGSGQDIAIHFHDGAVGARVTDAKSAAKATPAADPKKSDRKTSPKKKKDGRQGELL